MNRFLIVLFILVVFAPAFSQSKPLTQAEYVKMLYTLEKSPSTKSDVISALRTRGIDFAVTDGIRGLTRSKSGNDEDIRRALEEAERRRQNPESTKLPGKPQADALLARTRQKTLEAVAEMPDFVVKQIIQRSIAYAGTGTFTTQDNLIVAVSYRSTGQEDYKLLSVNGILQNDPKPKTSYEEVGGTSSTGEFVTMLAVIFKPESETKFEAVQSDVVRGRNTIVFDFTVEREKADQQLTCKVLLSRSTSTGMKGRIWIDREDARVLKIESEATDIPADFPCPTAKRNIDYDWAVIAGDKYLLPVLSDVRLTRRDHGKLYETRNVIRFRNYQKFGTEVIVVEEDKEPPEDKKPL
jgi:hypothetical protein